MTYVLDGYYTGAYIAENIWIDWDNKIINVPKSNLLLIQSSPTEIYQLDLNEFRLDLKALEASIDGMAFLDTHLHYPPVSVGGVTLARVVQIINDYTVTFEDGKYAVNLLGANSNVGDVINVNQVSVRSANSAGLTYSKEIEDLSFGDGRIWIDTIYGSSGAQYPRGTTANPTSSYEYAEEIATGRNLPHRFWLNGHETLSSYDEDDHSDWMGSAPTNAQLTFAGCDTHYFNISRITVNGVCAGYFHLSDGIIGDITDFEGHCVRSGLAGTIVLPSTMMHSTISFIDCFSNIPGITMPILDCNNASNALIHFRGYNGGLVIKNYTSPDNAISIDINSGYVLIDSTCTAGTIIVRGTGEVTDNSTGTTVISNVSWSEAEKDAALGALTSIANVVTLLQKYQENRSVIDSAGKTLTIYDDDNLTPILVFSLLDSVGTPSILEVAERVPQ